MQMYSATIIPQILLHTQLFRSLFLFKINVEMFSLFSYAPAIRLFTCTGKYVRSHHCLKIKECFSMYSVNIRDIRQLSSYPL